MSVCTGGFYRCDDRVMFGVVLCVSMNMKGSSGRVYVFVGVLVCFMHVSECEFVCVRRMLTG